MPEVPQPARAGVERDTSSTSLVSLWRAIRKNWVLSVSVAGVVMLVATFFTLGQKKIYRASGTIQIDPTPPRPLGDQVQGVVEMGTGAYLNNREYYETQYSIIKSMRLAAAVARDLGLHRDADFLANSSPGEHRPPVEVSIQTAAEVLRSRLEVEPEKQSRLTRVAYQDANPERARRIADAVIRIYRDENLDSVLSSTTQAVEWLDSQLGKLSKELESSERALHSYKKNKNILSVSIDDQSNMLREEMKQLNTALTSVRTKEQELRARYNELAKVKAENVSEVPATELLENELLSRLRQDYIASERELDSLVEAGKGSNHPQVLGARARLEVTRGALLGEIRNIQGALARDLEATKRNVGGLRGLYDSAQKRALELSLLEIDYNSLRRTKDNTEKLYSIVQERAKESDLTRMMRVNNIQIVDEPQLPVRPAKPSVPTNLAIGLLFGVVLGLGAALAREMLDRSVKSPDDIERELGLTFLGLLPQVGDEPKNSRRSARRRSARGRAEATVDKPELVIHRAPTSGLAEAARAIRTNIMLMAPDRPYRTLLVTSAAPAEGKTMIACWIASAMAQAGQRVVLVDGDMRRPRVHRVFGSNRPAGVTTALLNLNSLDEALVATEVPNLTVLPCGPVPPNPAELLHSDSFGKLLDELSQRFDRVVIDSPPLAPVTDAAILSTRVDGTLMVVRALHTTKDVVRRATRALRDVGSNIVGVVLNAVDEKQRNYGYYYQYYYYRHEGYGPTADDPPASTNSPENPAAPPH